MQPKKHTIVYFDDDIDDVELLQQAVQTIDHSHQLIEATDSEFGFAKLLKLKEENRLPCLIVLDLNMPKLNGREVYHRIKSDEALAKIPVVIFSTSNNPADKFFFQDRNVEFITKPVTYTHLLNVASKLLDYCN